jgi:Flp pilus assembly protein TadG
MKVRGPASDTSSQRIGRCDSGVAAVEFALIAPILLLLIFGIIIYSLYFTAYMGVRLAATEGARAAVMGLSPAERTTLARTRVTQVLTAYRPLIGTTSAPQIVAAPLGNGLFRVSVTYDITASPIMKYASLLPMPTAILTSEMTVSNGSY